MGSHRRVCGIAGFIDAIPKRKAAELATTVRSMADALGHRGPDDAGTWVDETAGLALGHRRLAIVDLSPTGHQPMVSASGRLVIVLNGEIYNHRELRTEMESSGLRFRGTSDTEVLIEAVERWGVEDTLARTRGMFAFALWDAANRTITLVRDRLGEKPLYYGWQGTTFLFGSQLKALRRHPSWVGAVDRQALTLYMRLACVPAPWSIHEDVHQLPPGTWLRLPLARVQAGPGGTSRIEPTAYWSAMAAARKGLTSPFLGSADEAIVELDALLREAIEHQMIADVPLGAFLSGGLDSSTVVALMQAGGGRPVKTFAIGFHDAAHDEAHHARTVAEVLGTEHRELYVSAQEALSVVPHLADVYDEPFADPSQVPTQLLAKLAREQVTVSLSGDGGDELFAGYDRYIWTRRLWSAVGRLPPDLRRTVAGLALALPEAGWSRLLALLGPLAPAAARKPNVGAKVHRLARLAQHDSAREIYLRLVSKWPDPTEVTLRGSEPPTVLTEAGESLPWRDIAEELALLDLVTYLPHDILVKVDRAAMAVGLETRVPFLDHRVVEFACRLPPSLKIRRGRGKWLLRQVLARYVPARLTERPKAGFGVPLDAWLRGPLRTWAYELLDAGRMREQGYLDVAPVWAAWEQHLSGARNNEDRLWNVLMFQAWLARWQASR